MKFIKRFTFTDLAFLFLFLSWLGSIDLNNMTALKWMGLIASVTWCVLTGIKLVSRP